MLGENDEKTYLSAREKRSVVDATLIKSLGGILRIVAAVSATVNLCLIVASLFASVGGLSFCVGLGFLIYIAIFIVVETCVPNVRFHRLVDAIVLFAYAALFFVAAILNTTFGLKYEVVLTAVASIFGYVAGLLCIIVSALSLKDWKKMQHIQNQQNVAIF